MSKTLSLFHLVINTYKRKMTITEEHKKSLYAYIFGILKNHDCFVHRINGISNHIHILFDLHPSLALANVVKDIKQSSSVWLRINPSFPDWEGWGK